MTLSSELSDQEEEEEDLAWYTYIVYVRTMPVSR